MKDLAEYELEAYMPGFLRTMADNLEAPLNSDIDALCIIVRKSGICSVVQSHQNLTDAALMRTMAMLVKGQKAAIKKRKAEREV